MRAVRERKGSVQFGARGLRRRLHLDQASQGALQLVLGPRGMSGRRVVHKPTDIRQKTSLRLTQDFRTGVTRKQIVHGGVNALVRVGEVLFAQRRSRHVHNIGQHDDDAKRYGKAVRAGARHRFLLSSLASLLTIDERPQSIDFAGLTSNRTETPIQLQTLAWLRGLRAASMRPRGQGRPAGDATVNASQSGGLSVRFRGVFGQSVMAAQTPFRESVRNRTLHKYLWKTIRAT